MWIEDINSFKLNTLCSTSPLLNWDYMFFVFSGVLFSVVVFASLISMFIRQEY